LSVFGWPGHVWGTVLLSVIRLVLVIAPDDGVRRSLEFVLEVEGYVVDSHAVLTTAIASPFAATAACAVVDEDAVEGLAAGWEAIGHLDKPIVLLVDWLRPLPDRAGMKVLGKPLLGHVMIEAVQSMIDSGAASS
jgi:hypothetical protein